MNESHTAQHTLSSLQQAGTTRRDFALQTLALTENPRPVVFRLRRYAGTPLPHWPEGGLPDRVGACCGRTVRVLCLGPDEWLLIADSDAAAKHIRDFAEGLDPARGRVYDRSDAFAHFRLSGRGAPWLLCKLSGFDFIAAPGNGDYCARTRMQHLEVTVHYHENSGEPVFDLLVERGLARYFYELLEASAPHADELAEAQGEAA